jgi:hypothetical protein
MYVNRLKQGTKPAPAAKAVNKSLTIPSGPRLATEARASVRRSAWTDSVDNVSASVASAASSSGRGRPGVAVSASYSKDSRHPAIPHAPVLRTSVRAAVRGAFNPIPVMFAFSF